MSILGGFIIGGVRVGCVWRVFRVQVCRFGFVVSLEFSGNGRGGRELYGRGQVGRQVRQSGIFGVRSVEFRLDFCFLLDGGFGGFELQRGRSVVGFDLESIWIIGMSVGLMWFMVCGLSGQAGWLSFSFEFQRVKVRRVGGRGLFVGQGGSLCRCLVGSYIFGEFLVGGGGFRE